MPAELEVAPEGGTPPEETAPGPEVTPEESAPAPQPTEVPVDDGAVPSVDALLGRLASGAATANDQEMVRRLYGHTDEIKTLKADLATAKGSDPAMDRAEKLLREECGTDAELAAQHRRWISEAPGGAVDYIEAVHAARAKGGAADEKPDETEEQRQQRLIDASVAKALEPQRVATEKAQVSAKFTTDLDGAIKGMKIGPEIAAHVRVKILQDMGAWLKTGVPTFVQFMDLAQGTQMADVVQARATEMQTLIDAVRAGKAAPPPALPEATPVPTKPAPPSGDTPEKSIDEIFADVGRKHDAKSNSGRGAS